MCEVDPGPRQAKQVATERLFKFLLTQIPHPLLQLPLLLLLQPASNNNAPGFLTVCTKNSVVHQTMLHQNLSTAVLGDAPKVFKKCQIEQTSRHTQDNRDISKKEGWQHVVAGRAKVYDECLVVLKLCLTHSPTELAHAL